MNYHLGHYSINHKINVISFNLLAVCNLISYKIKEKGLALVNPKHNSND